MTAIHVSYFKELAEKYFVRSPRTEYSDEEWENGEITIPLKELHWLASGLKYGCDQITEQRDYIQKLQNLLENSDSVEAMEYALQLHYKCVVRPVNEYCQAFDDWIQACREAAKVYDEGEGDKNWRSPPPLYEVKDHLFKIRSLDIGKSSYLARRLYGREPHRTEKCPLHDGHWSGLRFDSEPQEGCLCQTPDGEVTGWILPKENNE